MSSHHGLDLDDQDDVDYHLRGDGVSLYKGNNALTSTEVDKNLLGKKSNIEYFRCGTVR